MNLVPAASIRAEPSACCVIPVIACLGTRTPVPPLSPSGSSCVSMQDISATDVADGASNVSNWRQMGRELRHIADDLRRSTPSLVRLAIRSLYWVPGMSIIVTTPYHLHA
ncbi:hypothetical protein CBL_13974 [Carabus blaptoides fortunei]